MCGIAGFCNFAGDTEKNILKMCEIMYKRGPDGGGTWQTEDKTVTLGHRRLSVVDLTESGAQPMMSLSGRYVITFNGEIYNYQKIAKRLLSENKVSKFIGTSDTEVLLEAIEAYGLSETLKMSKGMFALAVYDRKEKKLSLARDRFGEKPLYYGWVNGAFVFASDIRAIALLSGFSNPVNPEILSLYFIHGYIPSPYSIYQDINKLDGGMILEINAPHQVYRLTSYWSLTEVALNGQNNPFKGSRAEAADELERLLKETISEQMIADVPVGAFLSAGIDSSTVVAIMQSLHDKPVKSFTIGIDAYDEAIYAKEIAKHLGCDHTEKYISENEAKAIIPLLGNMYGEPYADSSQIPTHLVSKITREAVTVSLSGDGGDELFRGYNSYRKMEAVYKKIHRIPRFVRKAAHRIILSDFVSASQHYRIRANLLKSETATDLYSNVLDYSPILHKISLNDAAVSYKHNDIDYRFLREPNHQLMLMDQRMYLPDDILAKVDRAAMAVSLETRVPLLDKDIVEFSWSLPIEYKRNAKLGKLVLRDVLYRYVPSEMMDRPKQGFGIPIERWLKDPNLRNWAEDLINQDTLKKQGFLDAGVVHQIWNDYAKNDNFIPQIWYILMFQNFLANEGKQTS
ncbi:MAG: asparagine synthase (glutamine-hydrolyzing) [Lachnospiraceae bacterium]|nr:asparagine synthase (glutamine-hydrolyzing) [Lachnospiraceae bacterium]